MAAYTFPVTRDDVANVPEESSTNPNPVMAVLAIGLAPISPTIEVAPVVEIPDSDRITKLPAVPRFTGVRVAGAVVDELELDEVLLVAVVDEVVVEVVRA